MWYIKLFLILPVILVMVMVMVIVMYLYTAHMAVSWMAVYSFVG